MSTICIYHKGCTDGFGAAWVVWQAFEGKKLRYGEKSVDINFHAAAYQTDPPEVKGKDVIIVDFSYKRPVMDSIIEECKSVIIIDHHKTAEADLEGIFSNPKVDGIFDMEHSGAMLAWNWFVDETEAPKLIQHIEDRDLWKFEIDGTRPIIAGLYSYPQEFELWDRYMYDQRALFCLHEEGKAIERQREKDIQSLIKSTLTSHTIGGFSVPTANIPYMMASDAGHILAKGHAFSATYYETNDSRVYSLRSSPDGVDVSAIASQYGGGGHYHAAGFKVSKTEIKQFDNN